VIDEFNLRKIRWQCRRGMLELDIVLEKFFDSTFLKLNAAEQQAFINLLDQPDPMLYAWLLGHEEPADAQNLMMIKKIKAELSLS
jgi:antitoxin CptB